MVLGGPSDGGAERGCGRYGPLSAVAGGQVWLVATASLSADGWAAASKGCMLREGGWSKVSYLPVRGSEPVNVQDPFSAISA
eukprot:scaffold347_cov380-Prasinococcus_capsulatus_cf.AAC.11